MTERFTLHLGDCLAVLESLPAESVDSVVTDPPYHLTSIVKRFGKPGSAPAQEGTDGAFARASRGFMGKEWDGGDVAFRPETWAAVMRVMKPGAHLLAFGGTRGYHRMACAIEDAGFEIRDCIMWMYSTGFPKSHNLDNFRGKIICNCDGCTVPYNHEKSEPNTEYNLRLVSKADISEAVNPENKQGKILQSCMSESCSSVEKRKQLSETEIRSGQSGLERWGDISETPRELCSSKVRPLSDGISADVENGRLYNGTSPYYGENNQSNSDKNGGCSSSRPQSVKQSPEQLRIMAGQSKSQISGTWSICDKCGLPIFPRGLGSALKPAYEPVVVARKPLSEGSIAENVLKYGTGAINIDGCRVGSEGGTTRSGQAPYAESGWRTGHEIVGLNAGRWPANVIHDGSPEVLAGFPESNGGSAARFFYTAKADSDDRNAGLEGFEAKREADRVKADGPGGNNPRNRTNTPRRNTHPCVKPTDLMRYLCRLVTPPGGLVLDPFMGSGSTGRGAMLEGFRFVGIERESEYMEIARARIQNAVDHPIGADTPLFSVERQAKLL